MATKDPEAEALDALTKAKEAHRKSNTDKTRAALAEAKERLAEIRAARRTGEGE